MKQLTVRPPAATKITSTGFQYKQGKFNQSLALHFIKVFVPAVQKIQRKSIYPVLILILLMSPVYGFSYTNSETLTYFSMGYYYLYNNEFKMAAQQFEICLRLEEEPPPVLYATLSEISNIMGEKEKAVKYALKTLELDPENESALQIMILILTGENRYTEVLPYLEKLYEKQPDNLQVLYFLVESYIELNNEDKLIDAYIKILQLNPDLLDTRLNLAFLYTKKGAFSFAENEYRTVLKADPENKKAIFYLTYIYLSKGKTEEALKLFEKLDSRDLLGDEMLEDYAINLFIENQDPKPVLRRIKDKDDLSPCLEAILLYLDGNLDKARRLFEKSVTANPHSIAPYVGLIRIAEQYRNVDMERKWRFVLAGNYYNLGMYEKSLKEAVRVEQINPEFTENRYLLGDIYSAIGMTEKAIHEYEYFKDNTAENGDVFIKLGVNYDRLGRHEESIKSFISAIEYFPENDELYYFLGIEYRIIKDYQKAVKAFRKAVELNTKNAKYFFNLGVSYERLGEIDMAIVYLDKSLQKDDTNPSALNYLGYLLADAGIRLNEAKQYIEKALSIDPENGAYLDSMGWVYYKLSEYEKAREYLESAIAYIDDSDEENYLIYEHLGDVYSKLGMLEQACSTWERALKLKYIVEIQSKIEKVKGELGH